jgi:hypothetical protein
VRRPVVAPPFGGQRNVSSASLGSWRARVCVFPLQGYYCPSGARNATLCPGGYYCEASAATPTGCAAGTFCRPGARAETICPGGTYCATLSPNATVCAAGKYCPEGEGVLCNTRFSLATQVTHTHTRAEMSL